MRRPQSRPGRVCRAMPGSAEKRCFGGLGHVTTMPSLVERIRAATEDPCARQKRRRPLEQRHEKEHRPREEPDAREEAARNRISRRGWRERKSMSLKLKAPGTDHQIADRGHHRKPGQSREPRDERITGGVVHDGRDHSGTGRNRHADKIFLSWTARIGGLRIGRYVKTCQSTRPGNEERKARAMAPSWVSLTVRAA